MSEAAENGPVYHVMYRCSFCQELSSVQRPARHLSPWDVLTEVRRGTLEVHQCTPEQTGIREVYGIIKMG
jgi:hypothetical protein